MGKYKDHFIRMLKEYGYQKLESEKFERLSEDCEKRINEETGVRSKPFDSIPIHNPTSYVNELIHEQHGYYLAAERAKKEAERIWKKEHLEERMKVLNEIEKKIIELRFFKNMNQDKVAHVIKYCDGSYISKKEDKAINKMIKVKIE